MKNTTKPCPFRFLLSNTHRNNTVGDYTTRGSQRKFRFANGFGASVVKTLTSIQGDSMGGTYGADRGLYEVGILAWESEDSSELHYSNPVACGDVIGYLTADEVEQTLCQIRDLWIV